MTTSPGEQITAVIVDSENHGALLDFRRTAQGEWQGCEYVRGEEDGDYSVDEFRLSDFAQVVERVHLQIGMGGTSVEFRGCTPREGAAILSGEFVTNHREYEGVAVNGQWCEVHDGTLQWEGDIR